MSQAENQVIPEGYKQTEIGLIPEDWYILSIGDFTTKAGSGKTPTGGSSVYVDSGIPFVRSQNVGTGNLRLTDLAFITEATHATFTGSEIKTNDVLLNITGASIGRCALASLALTGGNVNQHVCIIRVIPSKVESYLLQTLINSDLGQNQIDSYQAGGNREGLNFSQVKNMSFAFSQNMCEQTAIANALSDVDVLVTELENLIAKKQAIKTATMQQLLTGKTRLPQFAFYSDINSTEDAVEGKRKSTKLSELGEIPEDWEVVKLPDVIWYQEGPGLRNWQFTNKGLKVINVTNLQETGKLNLDKTDRHITWEECEKTYKHFLCDDGDLVIASSGNSYCKSSIVREIDLPLLMNTSVIRFKAKSDIEQLYMTVYLRSKFFKDQIDLMITGGAQPNFGPFHLNKVLIPLPSSKGEQTVIGTILSDMDNEIQTLEQRLSKTRQIKQGMMQELLTGKTRLPFDKIADKE
ncbi:restriction endonuclease subunit S [Shewanella sp. HL-SH5]|uniref:restriction endonuclease subunit S n=1 Tax=Shewanella sp. HL-SH5 TaxID=3436241 RepID=UPI003EB78902